MSNRPLILGESRSGPRVELQLRIPADLPQFEGHFPGSPLLPGVAQIDWAVRLGCERLPVRGSFQGLSGLKFMKVIRPDAELVLELRWEEPTLDFRYTDARSVYSQGQVRFGP